MCNVDDNSYWYVTCILLPSAEWLLEKTMNQHVLIRTVREHLDHPSCGTYSALTMAHEHIPTLIRTHIPVRMWSRVNARVWRWLSYV